MDAKQRRVAQRKRKRVLGEYLLHIKVLERMEGFDVSAHYSDDALLRLFSLGRYIAGTPPPPDYWARDWELH